MERTKPRVLICDDSEAVSKSLIPYLREEDMDVVCASDGKEGIRIFRQEEINLVILDVMMPKYNGLEVCREIRKTSQIPIIMLSAKGEEVDRIVGLEIGADDYVVKPFSPHELAIRARKLMQRVNSSYAENRKQIAVGKLTIYPDSFEAYIEDQKVSLTGKEFKLLTYLSDHVGRVMSREQILNGVWGIDYVGDTRIVDALVKRLRQKLIAAGGEDAGFAISTIFGFGYKLESSKD